MIKVVYKPVSIAISVLGGVLAGAIFKRIWKIAAGEDWSKRLWTVAPRWAPGS